MAESTRSRLKSDPNLEVPHPRSDLGPTRKTARLSRPKRQSKRALHPLHARTFSIRVKKARKRYRRLLWELLLIARKQLAMGSPVNLNPNLFRRAKRPSVRRYMHRHLYSMQIRLRSRMPNPCPCLRNRPLLWYHPQHRWPMKWMWCQMAKHWHRLKMRHPLRFTRPTLALGTHLANPGTLNVL